MNATQEVGGSIPPGSTKTKSKGYEFFVALFLCLIFVWGVTWGVKVVWERLKLGATR